MKKMIVMFVLMSSSIVNANLIVNGDFEQGPTTSLYIGLYPGSTAVADWNK